MSGVAWTLAVVQMDCATGEPEANLAAIARFAREAAARQADLAVFPECATTGYFLGERLADLAEAPDGPTARRLGGIVSLRWERVDLERCILRVEETKTGEPLELPVTRQLAAIFERRLADIEGPAAQPEGWVFPFSRSGVGQVAGVGHFYGEITEKGGTRFSFHGLRNAFITGAERELMLPRSLTKRLVNHARPSDVTEGCAADWTVEQLREPAQRVADQIEVLMSASVHPSR